MKKYILSYILISLVINVYSNINDTIVTFTTTNPLCYNDSNGSIYSDINMQGVFDYLWSTGDSTSFITDVPAGTYQLTISNANAVINISTVELSQPDSLSFTSSISNPSAENANDGSIQLLITGGTNPYSFIWSTGETDFSISNLGAGIYFFTVTDNNGCELSDSIELVSPLASPWEIIITGSNHTILIPTAAIFQILGDSILINDFLGVFYDSLGVLKCAGFTSWQGDNAVISAFGDDPSSPGLQGMANGEEFKWRIWRSADSTIYDLSVSYSNTFPNLGAYVDNGMSMVDSISTLSIAGDILLTTKTSSTGLVIANKISGSNYKAVAWAYTDNLHYIIDGLEFGTYIIHSLPNPFNNSFSPVYYPFAETWTNADEIVLTAPLENVNIPFVNLPEQINGTRVLNGTVYTDYPDSYEYDIYTSDWFEQGMYTDSSLAMNIPILLFNENNQLVNYTLTDSAGNYRFDNIENGNYTLYAEKTGFSSDVFSFDNEMQHYTVDFHIQETHISFDSYSISNTENGEILLFPNPVINSLNIEGLFGNENIYIVDVMGREILKAKVVSQEERAKYTIDLSSQPQGIYFISIKGNNEQKIYKIVKR